MKKIIATGKGELMPKGKEYWEGEELAAILVKGGYAVYEGSEVPAQTPDTANKKFSEEIKQDKPKKSK